MTFRIDPRVGAYTVGLFVEKSWLLRVRCACGHEGRIAHAQLVAMPAEKLIDDVVARLKCASCGGSEGSVDFLQDRSTPDGKLRAAPEQVPGKNR